ncbi:MAG: type II toxin-antitoxin system RelE/ParE family toxin [Hydrogenophaga sp.]|uniref:type II toxin-antitoxin system RelE/ParE family toxin n=1 Tax=Hydrogenophaga sp. TaxID=1904254 RepID=UPI00169831B2|nr:type II toxin-antitoxin system RelE/ParE family toxin [Hydrogenophaga sp.]NIM39840.1 type II toxin-antitoxin system RelE/ParE family toxin [Hydrogenophaga sp.]NIN25036.1 type II toxin-antitoxin system RelE/ParE family toxin [Hydrogenophaga sp.]NIN29603.1 type II toxin-antitoxin system RelE/ParE family toxin [Hydrogenophaga sp.]NIN54075.1 type II toxin-antitoxin system RelE/ParE family toxin [Hydrogenophaga sp.]NIO50488.1 type II toxin-antitoxin system RelE/ParE family toxin [Hydrogenophaga 
MAPIAVQLAEGDWLDLEELVAFLLTREDPAAPELMAFVLDGLHVLTHQPGVGRPAGEGLRELILHRGKSGYLVKYRYLPHLAAVRVLRIRHQRQSGYTERDI